jgi:hypothetical protein
MKYLDVPSSGSIADRTHSHNRSGQYTRNRRTPVQPVGSGRRAQVRSTFGAASTAWGVLTDMERAAWESFAPDHPVADSLGQSIVLTGHQMFIRVYATSLNVNLAAPLTPPADLALPDLSTIEFIPAVSSGANFSEFDGPDGSIIAFALSRPVSPGRSFMKTFWQPHGADGYGLATATLKAIDDSVYNAEFGAPAVGQRIFARLTPISADGWNGAPRIISAIVVA